MSPAQAESAINRSTSELTSTREDFGGAPNVRRCLLSWQAPESSHYPPGSRLQPPTSRTQHEMEEDSEVLDWGNEDDEVQVAESNRASVQQNGQDDAEDAVSLGGDEDDEIYPYRPVSHEDPSKARQGTPHASQSSQPHAAGKQEYQGENSAASQKPLSRQSDSSGLRRSQSLGQMTHALPPKPNFAPPPSPRPTPVTTSTLASAMVFRDKRSNGHGKNVSGSRDRGSGLPPDWEERYPRGGGRGPYYYNVKTHESTWSRPLVADSGPSSPAKERDVDTVRRPLDLSPRRNVPDDVSRSPHKEAKRPVSPGGPLSFDDRHYRPGSAALNGSSTAEVGLQPQGLGVGLPPRPVSPKVPERRRDARSVTPPPARRHARSLERPSRTRRDVSPPPMERGVPARDRVDVRRSPVLERAWDRPRDGYPQDETRGREYANERGRRPRDDPVSEHTRNGQDARESYPTWSAPSTLSASSLLAIHRIRRLFSSRGGGRSSHDCLEKPRDWSHSSRVQHPSPSSCPRLLADHGLLSFLFRPFVILPVLNMPLFVISSRASVSAASPT